MLMSLLLALSLLLFFFHLSSLLFRRPVVFGVRAIARLTDDNKKESTAKVHCLQQKKSIAGQTGKGSRVGLGRWGGGACNSAPCVFSGRRRLGRAKKRPPNVFNLKNKGNKQKMRTGQCSPAIRRHVGRTGRRCCRRRRARSRTDRRAVLTRAGTNERARFWRVYEEKQ